MKFNTRSIVLGVGQSGTPGVDGVIFEAQTTNSKFPIELIVGRQRELTVRPGEVKSARIIVSALDEIEARGADKAGFLTLQLKSLPLKKGKKQ